MTSATTIQNQIAAERFIASSVRQFQPLTLTEAKRLITEEEYEPFLAKLMNWMAQTAEKVTDEVIHDDERDNEGVYNAVAIIWAANEFARDGRDTFEYVREMAERAARHGISAAQVRGLWNCIRAQAIRNARQTVEASAPVANAPVAGLDLSGLPSGRYGVPGTDLTDRLKLRVNHVTKGKWAGFTFVEDAAEYGYGRKYGMQRPDQSYNGDVQDALRAIIADPAGGMVKYGQLTNRCSRCNRVLEDVTSVALGIGPDCRAK